MNLREKLEELETEYVKIGSDERDGGFIYCERTDEAIEALKDFDDEQMEWFERTICFYKTRLEFLSDEKKMARRMEIAVCQFKEDMRLYGKSQKKEYEDIKTERQLRAYIEKKRENQRKASLKRLAFLRDWMHGYSPIMGRRIVEVYPSIICPNEMIVIFKGFESKGYWDREEYHERKKNVRKDNY